MKTVQQSFPELAQALGVPELWLKREDTHPYGSHKGRSIPLMIKEYNKYSGQKNFVISSSGNAALAAALTVQKYKLNKPEDPLTLHIFVGSHIDPKKRKKLETFIDNQTIWLETKKNPKQSAFQMDKEGDAKNLRQSTDDTALRGYFELADEINKIENLSAIFVPTSSGTTAQGLAEAFEKLSQKPQIHIVQTPSCHPLVTALNSQTTMTVDTTPSLATAIVDQVALRKNQVVPKVQASGGQGWIADNQIISEMIALTEDIAEIAISANSALSLAGIRHATQAGWTPTGAVVALITGE